MNAQTVFQGIASPALGHAASVEECVHVNAHVQHGQNPPSGPDPPPFLQAPHLVFEAVDVLCEAAQQQALVMKQLDEMVGGGGLVGTYTTKQGTHTFRDAQIHRCTC